MLCSSCAGSEMMDEAFITACVQERARLEGGPFKSTSGDAWARRDSVLVCARCHRGPLLETVGPRQCALKTVGVYRVQGDAARGAIHPSAGLGERVKGVFTCLQGPDLEAAQGAGTPCLGGGTCCLGRFARRGGECKGSEVGRRDINAGCYPVDR